MSEKMNQEVIPHLAIGLGPSNLSLAALADDHNELNIIFIEKKRSFGWHEGALLPFSSMQSSFFRDLVTLADPTNKYSFISYLHQNKKLYHFMSANFDDVPRFEFNEYFKWVANQLTNIHFNEWVNEIRYENGLFKVHTSKKILLAKNLILGTGSIPYFPDHAVLSIEGNAFHGLEYCKKDKKSFKDKKVVIVGGGQTGAEVFLDLFTGEAERPFELTWISRRSLFNPMEESPFHSEIFTPSFSEYFYSLREEGKTELLSQHKLASDGISSATLSEIYKALYANKYHQTSTLKPKLLVNSDVTSQSFKDNHFELEINNKIRNATHMLNADIVIYCTGLEHKLPEFLNPIKPMLTYEKKGIETNEDFSAKLPAEFDNKIYVQNGSSSSWGISDKNLVLSAWRSAKIVNSILGREVYSLNSNPTFVDWKR